MQIHWLHHVIQRDMLNVLHSQSFISIHLSLPALSASEAVAVVPESGPLKICLS